VKALDNIDFDQTFMKSIKNDRAKGIEVMEQYRKNPMKTLAKWSESLDESKSAGKHDMSRAKPNLFFKFVANKDAAAYMKEIDKMMDCAGMRYRDAYKKNLLNEPEVPKYAFMSMMLLPRMKSFLSSRDTAIASTSATGLFIRLHQYHRRFGSYPESLKVLQDKLGCKLPDDPFTGKSYIYQRQESGFIFYSVGPNLVDDGGVATDRDVFAGDLLWKTEL
jgi:hypothetical protein